MYLKGMVSLRVEEQMQYQRETDQTFTLILPQKDQKRVSNSENTRYGRKSLRRIGWKKEQGLRQ